MYKADKYFIETIKDIQENGIWSVKPRTVWEDGTVAHYKSLKIRSYNKVQEDPQPLGVG